MKPLVDSYMTRLSAFTFSQTKSCEYEYWMNIYQKDMLNCQRQSILNFLNIFGLSLII